MASRESSSVGRVETSPLKHYSVHEQFNQIYAAAISGFLTRFCTQPLDVLKIRFQLQVEPLHAFGKEEHHTRSSKYKTISQACGVIYREEGIPGFWKGHIAGQYMTIIYSILQFWTYEQVHLLVSQTSGLQHHENVVNFASGAAAGCFATMFSTPFDVVRTRLVAQDTGQGYKSIWGAFPDILRRDGVPGLFRGFGTSLLQIAPMVGANFTFYKIFNDIASKILKPDHGELSGWCLFITGGAAGCASKAVVYPLDFIKKRLQMRGFETQRRTYGRTQYCRGIVHCIALTIKEEGYMGFYKGMAPTLLKSAATTAFYFSIYDKCKILLSDG